VSPAGPLDADVIIAGGGLVGCTFAGLLARLGIRCLIVEERDRSGAEETRRRDPRVLAITPGSVNILRAAGAWDRLPVDRIGHFRGMHVWEEKGSGEISFDSAELCEPALGYIVDQAALEEALERAVENLVSWCRPATVDAMIAGDDCITLTLAGGRRLEAVLAVAAEGARSRLRALAGIEAPVHDYHQHAIACRVATERPHGEIARQRFLEDGPVAFLPMADPRQCGVVWSTSPARAADLLRADEAQFNRELAQAFDDTLGAILASGPRSAFPLQHAQARQYCAARLALIGDAAHTLHPLAGQGANQGLLDAAALAEVIVAARARQRNIGAHRVLRRYERWRRGENALIMRALQGLKYLFESKSQTLNYLRNLGLEAVDSARPLKHAMMRYAMGRAGDLPKLARGLR